MSVKRFIKNLLPPAATSVYRRIKLSIPIQRYRIRRAVRLWHSRKDLRSTSLRILTDPVVWTTFNENSEEVVSLQKIMGYHRKSLFPSPSPSNKNDFTCISANHLLFRGHVETNDEWIAAIAGIDSLNLSNYSVKFSFKKGQNFQELQFAFRYHNLGSRLRFRLDGNQVFFERIHDMRFEHRIDVAKCHIVPDKWYSASIQAFGHYYALSINERLVMDAIDLKQLPTTGDFGIITWETDSRTPIDLEVKDICFFEIYPNQLLKA